MDEGAQCEPACATNWYGAAQPAPDFKVDSQINGWQDESATRMSCGVGLHGPQQMTLPSGACWWDLVMNEVIAIALTGISGDFSLPMLCNPLQHSFGLPIHYPLRVLNFCHFQGVIPSGWAFS